MWDSDAFRDLLQPPVIGMIHLPALPGAPLFNGDLEEVVAAAVADAQALVAGGIHAAMVENFHDIPFWPGRVPPETVAAMAVVLAELRRRHSDLVIGVNVLRNDPEAALALAAVAGAAFVRINVHAGAMLTDQGPLRGRAHRTLRRRRELGLSHVGILADIRVKHAVPLAERGLVEEAADLRFRAQADALIVSGLRTGAPADHADLSALRKALPGCPLLVGSGMTSENLQQYHGLADGFIVGSSLQQNGRIDRVRVAALTETLDRLDHGSTGKSPR